MLPDDTLTTGVKGPGKGVMYLGKPSKLLTCFICGALMRDVQLKEHLLMGGDYEYLVRLESNQLQRLQTQYSTLENV